MVSQRYHFVMPNLTIKQIPLELVDRIKDRARLNGRSMNKEIIACLRSIVMPEEQSADEVIQEARALRAKLGLENLPPYDPKWKREGLP